MRGLWEDGPHLDLARAREQGRGFAELKEGFVHYELSGPEDGTLIVLVHGMATPMFIWDRLVPALVGEGFRVLRYDQYGRGLSARPRLDYDQDLYDGQLVDLLEHLELRGEFLVAGLSMGGLIAAEFAGRHPGRVRGVCLVAPAGLGVELPWSVHLLRLPWIGDWVMQLVGKRVLLGAIPKNFHRSERFPEFRDLFRKQLEYAGFFGALVSGLRRMPVSTAPETYHRLASLGKPILAIWGRQDRVTPLENSDALKSWCPTVELEIIEDAGHVVVYEQAESVAAAMIPWLRRLR